MNYWWLSRAAQHRCFCIWFILYTAICNKEKNLFFASRHLRFAFNEFRYFVDDNNEWQWLLFIWRLIINFIISFFSAVIFVSWFPLCFFFVLFHNFFMKQKWNFRSIHFRIFSFLNFQVQKLLKIKFNKKIFNKDVTWNEKYFNQSKNWESKASFLFLLLLVEETLYFLKSIELKITHDSLCKRKNF